MLHVWLRPMGIADITYVYSFLVIMGLLSCKDPYVYKVLSHLGQVFGLCS